MFIESEHPRKADGKWTDGGDAIKRAASDGKDVDTEKNDHLLAAERMQETGGRDLYPLEISVDRTENTIQVFHSVTGSHLADIDADKLSVSIMKSGGNDEKIKALAETIKTNSKVIVLERNISSLKNYPVRNEDEIKAMEQKIKSLKSK